MDIYFLLLAYIVLLVFASAYLVFEVYTLIIAPMRGSPYAPTRRSRIETAFMLAQVKQGELVVDLGSGNGGLLIEAARRGARAVGVEINPFFVWYSRWRIRWLGLERMVRVVRGDLFAHPVSDADVVFLYLVPDTMRKLSEKLRGEMRPGARIIVNQFPLLDWTFDEARNQIFLYRMRA